MNARAAFARPGRKQRSNITAHRYRARISVLDPAQLDRGYLHVVVLDRYARSGVIVDSSLVMVVPKVGRGVVDPSSQFCIPLSHQFGTIFGFESLDYEMTSSH